jgi:hypothetical protein
LGKPSALHSLYKNASVQPPKEFGSKLEGVNRNGGKMFWGPKKYKKLSQARKKNWVPLSPCFLQSETSFIKFDSFLKKFSF